MLRLFSLFYIIAFLSDGRCDAGDDVNLDADSELRPHVDLQYYDSQLDCRIPDISPSAKIQHDLKQIHVVYSCDRPGFPGLLRSMISLARNLEFPADCTIHLIISRTEIIGARSLVEHFHRELETSAAHPMIQFHELRSLDIVAGDADQTEVHMFRPELVKPYTFVPFYLHRYFVKERRVLWLDIDTIVKVDIGVLYHMPMRHAFAAAPEAKTLPTLGAVSVVAKEKLGVRLPIRRLNRKMLYLNIGVLLLDLEKWRSIESIEYKLENHTRRWSGFLFAQLALNVEFQGRADVLDWRWNVLGLGYWPFPLPDLCEKQARILHWHGPHKYWHSNRSWFMKFNDRLATV